MNQNQTESNQIESLQIRIKRDWEYESNQEFEIQNNNKLNWELVNWNQIKSRACEPEINQSESLWTGNTSVWELVNLIEIKLNHKTDSNQIKSLWIRININIFWPLPDKRPLQRQTYDALSWRKCKRHNQGDSKDAHISVSVWHCLQSTLSSNHSQWQTHFIKVLHITGPGPSFWWNGVFLDPIHGTAANT